MADPVSIAISSVSLGISASTLWLNWLRHGQLRMTKPMIVFFGYDFSPRETPKVFLRCLLYSTAVRGVVVEGMYAKVRRGHTEQLFSFWGLGETNALVPGSGLFVGQSGVAAYHHFVLSVHESAYAFSAGQYTIEVFARQARKTKPVQLGTVIVTLSDDQAAALANRSGVLFELEPTTQRYVGDVDSRGRLTRHGLEGQTG